jgi:steroid delta-isomerase-like uncharacterized protein
MGEEYKTLLEEWFNEVWNKRDANAIDRLAAADVIAHGLLDENGNELRGVQAFKAFHGKFINAFPDLHVEVADSFAQGDRVVARCIVRGTHRGDALGFKATSRNIRITGMAIARVKDGKVVEAWNDFDFLTMHRQLDSLKLLLQTDSK